MTAAERLKMRLANALERICLLEEQLELALQRIDELEHSDNGTVVLSGDRHD